MRPTKLVSIKLTEVII